MNKVKESRKLYRYEGTVVIFGRVVARQYKAQTLAVSAAKARSNIAWQYHKIGNVADGIPVNLPGEIVEVPAN